VNNLKSSPSPTSGFDFPSAAKKVWNEILEAYEALWNSYQEIIVPEGFEVKNGVLKLHQYIYLNIIQFLNSSIVRKV
jgi:hypothetical protein